jgi:putative transcriptional regulator
VTRHFRSSFFAPLAFVVVAAFGSLVSTAHAEDQASAPDTTAPEAMVLVAKPSVQDHLLGASVLLVMPLQSGGHAGFILNKPTQLSLGQAFPDDEPSQKVHDPVYLGGPINPNVIFALVKRSESPGEGAIRFAKDLFLVMSGEAVDHVIQNEADHARFLAGAMVWQPGELKEQIDEGAWYVRDADSEVVIRKDVENLWEELVADSERHAKAF